MEKRPWSIAACFRELTLTHYIEKKCVQHQDIHMNDIKWSCGWWRKVIVIRHQAMAFSCYHDFVFQSHMHSSNIQMTEI